MTMTKKDYELIANDIKGHLHSADTHVLKQYREIERYAIEGLAVTLADSLQLQNPMFDRTRFLQACGISAD